MIPPEAYFKMLGLGEIFICEKCGTPLVYDPKSGFFCPNEENI